MKAPEVVFASSTAVALEWWQSLQDRDAAYRAAVAKIRDLYPDRQIWEYSDIRGRRISALGGPKPGAEWVSTRDGWRPKKGRQGDAELQALWGACSTTYDRVPGMPVEVWGEFNPRTGGTTIHKPGFHLLGGDLWCLWAAEPDAEQVDLTIWERRKPSAYHLAREASEAADTDRGGVK